MPPPVAKVVVIAEMGVSLLCQIAEPNGTRIVFKLAATLDIAILFTVDDEVDLEGKKVNIIRGVTLGKLLTSLVVFVAGFWLAKWLSRRFQRMC